MTERKELLNELETLSNAFGPSGYEEEVIRAISSMADRDTFDIKNDAMLNLYMRSRHSMPGGSAESVRRPVIMLDAHTDECGFVVQAVRENGLLDMIVHGSMLPANLTAQSVIIRTAEGKKVRGIIATKPVHFMTAEEKTSQQLTAEALTIDIGASSREEVTERFGVRPGDPAVPDTQFSTADNGVCFGKAFDNRAGCLCVLETMKELAPDMRTGAADGLYPVPVGAFAVQEEVGARGADVTVHTVKPDLAIVFEGAPSDDFYAQKGCGQCEMKKGVQIRLRDISYITNTAFARFAEETAKEEGIPYQISVRRGGGTNAGTISLKEGAVPTVILSVPCRYVHTHCGFCAPEDIEATVRLAAAMIRRIDAATAAHLCRQDVLE